MAGAALAVTMLTAAPWAPGGGGPAAGLSLLPAPYLWVTALYDDVLERSPTAAQQQARVDQMEAGRSRRAIADELVGSAEHAGVIVDRIYARVLGRAADSASRSYWIGRLRAGERPTTVASFLYGSPELFTRHGGTAEAYVTFLYRDVLGREPDAAGAAYWTGRVEAGENRTGLARAWLLTPEATGLKAVLVFLDVLGRQPTPAEQADWAGRIRAVDERRVLAALVSTDAHYQRAKTPWASTRLTRGNDDSSDPAISASGRIVAFASTADDLTPAGSPAGSDIYVLDRRTGRTRAITAGNGASTNPFVSPDGSTVVFESAASNLVAGDTNGNVDVFRASTRGGGTIEKLTSGNGQSRAPRTNDDGSIVVFTSSSDLLDIDDGFRPHVYVWTEGAAIPLQRVEGLGGDTLAPDISADGGTLVYQEDPIDEGPSQAYLQRLPLGTTPVPIKVSVDEGATPTVSQGGSLVAYAESTPEEGPSVHLVELQADTIEHRVEIGSASDPQPRLADGGEGILLRRIFPAGSAPVPPLDTFVRFGSHQSVGVFGLQGSDLRADGRLVVGTMPIGTGVITQIEMFDTVVLDRYTTP
ncbi:MAG TPA: DUF4214 domain-containing protein [Iamia sp.]